MRRAVLCLALAALPGVARAHGDVHHRIEVLDRELADHPNDAALLVERGALYATDEDWPRAVRDFEQARELDPAQAGLDERLANALLQVGEPERAAALLDDLVDREPRSAEAHLLRARTHARVGRFQDADADFAEAIALAPKPSPRMYLDRVDVVLEQGPSRADSAIAVLESAFERLGPLIGFVERATEIEAARGRPDEALAWIERLPEAARTAPDWRLRRATILEAKGSRAEAAREVEAGLAAIDALPASRRDTEALQALRAELLVVQSRLAPEGPERHGHWLWVSSATGALIAAALLLRRRRALSRAK